MTMDKIIYGSDCPILCDAGVFVGGVWITVDQSGWDERGRPAWAWAFILADGSAVRSTKADRVCGPEEPHSALQSLLHFLTAWVDAIRWEQSSNRSAESSDLFPHRLREWALDCSDEIDLMAFELDQLVDGLSSKRT